MTQKVVCLIFAIATFFAGVFTVIADTNPLRNPWAVALGVLCMIWAVIYGAVQIEFNNLQEELEYCKRSHGQNRG